jgi:serine/threonine-protein kinase
MRVCPRCHARYPDDSRFCPRDGAPLPASEGDPRVGTVLFGQFELLEVCGRGAMGTVYRAFQTGMDRQVAIKILRAELLRDPAVVKRFHREARAVARIQHPNIVTVFLVGETEDGLPYLVMEYVDGEVLSETITRTGVFEPVRALRIARQITSALADAHAEGIVHRDLKPANIILSQRRRASDFVKVLDFGIAKILRADAAPGIGGESHLTRSGTIFGTPHYIAPEQASGADVDHRADLYSVGVILYRMLTGQLPFDGTGIAVLLAHVQKVPPRPREVRPELDPAVEALLLRALAKDPAARFQTAEEMSDALDAQLQTPAAALSWASWTAGPQSSLASGVSPPAGTSSDPVLLHTVKGVALSMPAPPEAAPEPTGFGSRTTAGRAGLDVGAGVAVASPLPPVTPHAPLIAPPHAPMNPPMMSSSSSASSSSSSSGEAPLYLDGSDSWRPPTGRMRKAVIAGSVAALCAGVAVAGAYFLGKNDQPAAKPSPSAATTPDAAPVAAIPSPATSDAGPVTPVAWRIITLGEDGYAVRVLVPPRLESGADTTLIIEVWDPSGKPLAARQLRVGVEEPSGGETPLMVPVSSEAGRFTLERKLQGGHYHLHIYLDPAQPKLHVWCDLDVDGAPAPRPTIPVEKDEPRHVIVLRAPPSDSPPPPMPPRPPIAIDAGVDPYHIIEDQPHPDAGNPDGLE